MLETLSLTELVVFSTVVLICCYFVGTFVNEIVEAEGFGTVGNMFVLATGAFGGLWLSNYYRMPQNDEIMLALWGVAGAFLTLVLLVLMKMGARRLGM
jgi:uncharacterized membrane protein YeaQ/YmgE (transglycosylase-associated protein family)